MKKKITAIVAVRKGSKRVPNKNIRRFSHSSLLQIKIKQLIRAKGIDEIIVSTDCEKMHDLAKNYGVTVSLRDSKLASDQVPMNQVYESLAKEAAYDHILYAHVTSPLLEDASLDTCIKAYQDLSVDYDSLATVRLLKEYMWRGTEPLNYDPHHHPRSQDLPEIYSLSFAVNMIPKHLMIKYKNIVGRRFFPIVLGKIESVDVDEEEDFRMAEVLYEKFYLSGVASEFE